MNARPTTPCCVHGHRIHPPGPIDALSARLRCGPDSLCACTVRFGVVALLQLLVLTSAPWAQEPSAAGVAPATAAPPGDADPTPSDPSERDAAPPTDESTGGDVPPADAPIDGDEHDHDDHQGDHLHHDDMEELVVTASPLGRTRFSVLQGTNVLDGEELARKRSSSIGQTLSMEPGIHSDFFSPAASRPVIRGQQGVRVDVLNDGLRALDASSESPDHATTAEAITAQRIEVLRGPATLLYGSAAAGGVVNVLTGRIPKEAPEDDVRVEATGDYGSNGHLREGGGMAEQAMGDFVVHVDGFGRAQDDYAIPGYAESDALLEAEGETREGPPEGKVDNSSLETHGAGGGVSWIQDWGHVGVSAGWYGSNYGVPGHSHEEDPPPAVPEPPVRIDLDRWRVDLEAVADTDLVAFDETKLRFGYSGYEHRELEGDETGTVFTNDGFDLRLEMGQAEWGLLDGSVGVQVTRSDFGAVGEEAFIPEATTNQLGLFALEEVALDRWVEGLGLDLGLRYEYEHIGVADDPNRVFNGVSVSAGLGWQLGPDYLVGVTGFRNVRLPESQELYSYGPHLATQSWDIGDPNLGKEIGKGVELSFRRQGGRLTGGISLFYVAYDDFVYREATGQLDPVDGELPVFQYVAENVEFYGGEIDAHLTVWEHDDFSVGLDTVVDYVRAARRDGSENLPRIPPLRILGGVEVGSRYADLHFDTEWVRKQDLVAPFELPTDGYVMVNLALEVRPLRGEDTLSVFMTARNLADQEARSHSSALKDLAPLPGRDFRVGLTLRY